MRISGVDEHTFETFLSPPFSGCYRTEIEISCNLPFSCLGSDLQANSISTQMSYGYC